MCEFFNFLLLILSAFIADLEAHHHDSTRLPPKEDSPLLFELANYLEWTGISDPLAKIYITSRSPFFLDFIATLLAIQQVSKLVYVKRIHGLSLKKGAEPCDGTPFVIGFLTFLRQFHETVLNNFVAHTCQYILSATEIASSA